MKCVKEGRYTYFIIPENGVVKCVSHYAKKPVVGIARCASEDEFDAGIGKKIARIRCDQKVNKKRMAFLRELSDYYYNQTQYNMRKYGQIQIKLGKAEDECRELLLDISRIKEL